MNQLTEAWHEGLAPAQKWNAQRVEMTNALRNTLLHSLLAQLRICIHIRSLKIACVQTVASAQGGAVRRLSRSAQTLLPCMHIRYSFSSCIHIFVGQICSRWVHGGE